MTDGDQNDPDESVSGDRQGDPERSARDGERRVDSERSARGGGRAGSPGGTPPVRRSRSDSVSRGREHLWRFLRTLVGLLLLSWLVSALFAPPDPFTFLLALVPQWVLAVPVSWYLVYRDGYDRLRASGLYDPRVPPAQALAAFVVVAVLLKVVATVALDGLIGNRPYVVDLGLSVLVLGVAYAVVYVGSSSPADDATA